MHSICLQSRGINTTLLTEVDRCVAHCVAKIVIAVILVASAILILTLVIYWCIRIRP